VGDVNILAIETATAACAVAVGSLADGAAAVLNTERHHTEWLVPGIRNLLGEIGLRPRDLERIVVDRGPGLFTGLRVGIATAESLALALGIDLVGATSLEVFARGRWADGIRGEILAVVDARRGEVFTELFDSTEEGVRSLGPARVEKPDGLAAHLRPGIALAGDGAVRYRPQFEAAGALVHDRTVPPVHTLLVIGSSREPTGEVAPLYLREADAVARFATRDTPT
jgi:tRNA threonylcarbamoyladenosine biosynthesis protein TsaB